MYTYLLDLRFLLAAYVKAYHVLLMIFCVYMTFVHLYATYIE